MARIPESIGKYKIESLVAKGGMGAVYKAIHPTLNRPVIIKKLNLRGRKDITERFKREARILMDFRHDGIVNMYDHFKLGTSYYIVLEFIDGKPLDEIIKKERYLDNGTTAYILYHTALALNYAHNKKVIHRDIKPANLLLSKKGEVKLVDFGIAVSDEDSDVGLTKEGMTLGTPGYMAPEQFHDSKNVDHRADIYGLGVLAYETLTGKKPFPGSFTPELVTTIQKGKYTNPKRYNPHISRTLLKIIKKSMHPNPERRYKNLTPIIKKLEHFLKKWDSNELTRVISDLASGKEHSKPKQTKKKRTILRLILITFGLLLLILGGLFCYKTGIHNEILHPGNYGYVAFSVQIPSTVKPVNKIYIHANIFNYGNKISKVKNRKIIFRRVRKKNNNKTFYFRSFPVYIKTGSYRAKVEIEDSLNWYNFVILPGEKRIFSSKNKKVITIKKYKVQQIPINISINSFDIFTGKTIFGTTITEVYKKGKWVNIKEAGPLFSGKTYRFRIKNKLYYTKYFSIKLKEGQKDLNINIGLVPLPGILTLRKENEHIHFLLDGHNNILSAEKIPREISLNNANSKQFTGKIAPGEYTLKIIYKDKKELIPIKIEAQKKILIVASIDQKTGQIKSIVQ